MRIAFISYEYPPDTAFGGIATYVSNMAKLLTARGHDVEVFTGSLTRTGAERDLHGVLVHRLEVAKDRRSSFSALIAPVFQSRHKTNPFDVIEGPELFRDAAEAVRMVKDTPLVICIHAPRFLVKKLKASVPPPAVRRVENGQPTVKHYLRFNRRELAILGMIDHERKHALEADRIVVPSQHMLAFLTKIWKLDLAKVAYIPLPYEISDELLRMEQQPDNFRITYIGRLEHIKGVLDLAAAIPDIVKAEPRAIFRFVGDAQACVYTNKTMKEIIEEALQPYLRHLEFMPHQPLDKVPTILRETNICVFPSLFENFPYVVREAMAAGRAVLASVAGGGRDLINDPDVGRVLPPGRPDLISRTVVELLKNPALTASLGNAARKRMLEHYNNDVIIKERERVYEEAIEARKRLGARV